MTAPGPGYIGQLLPLIRRRYTIVPDDEPERGHESPDGNPWCERCHGGRRLAIRIGREPATYVDCPDCKCAQWRVDKYQRRLNLSVPKRFQACRLETYPRTGMPPLVKPIVECLRDWMDDPEPTSLYLHGRTGVGKTGLAVALLYALAERGQVPAFSIITDLLTTIKSTFGAPDGESEWSIIDEVTAADVFALDDLGAEYHRVADDWASEKIFQLIGARHAAMKRTIITSNYSLDELALKFGHARTVRRIAEACTSEAQSGNRWVLDMNSIQAISLW